jgi:hypothetical protein
MRRRVLLTSSAIGVILASTFLLLLAQDSLCRRLDTDAAKRFLPDRVPLESEVIPVDSRVLTGLQFSDKTRLVIAALATGGYSNSIRQKFQYILVSETRIKLDRWMIPSGIVGLGMAPQPDESSPTRMLILLDFTGSEIDRLTMNLDTSSPSVPLALTPKGDAEFELRIGKYAIHGLKR